MAANHGTNLTILCTLQIDSASIGLTMKDGCVEGRVEEHDGIESPSRGLGGEEFKGQVSGGRSAYI